MTTTRTRRLAIGTAGLLLGALTLAGCSNSSEEAATTPTPTVTATASPTVPASPTTTASPTGPASPTGSADAVCSDAAATKASLQGIVDVNVLQDGTNALRSNFATFKSDAETLIPSARTQFAPQSDAVKASVSSLQTAIDNLKDSPSVAEVAALAPALASIKSTTQALLDAVDAAC